MRYDREHRQGATKGVTVDLVADFAVDPFGYTDTLTSVENAMGSIFNDTLKGDADNNRLRGIEGNDTLNDGGAGNDRLWGGIGNDTYIVSSLNTVIDEAEDGGNGTDAVFAAIDFSLDVSGGQVVGNIENLTLTGAAITGTGNTLNNVLTGNSP